VKQLESHLFSKWQARQTYIGFANLQAVLRCALIAFCLLGHYPKPIEFFKIHFEEATPLANN